MADKILLDRNLTIEAVRVTEAAAIAAAEVMGRGDEKIADQAAVDAMRTALNYLHIAGTVVIGEGERDEAPMLFIGEEVGTGDGPKIDIALDPLEGTTITAKGMPNGLAVLALSEAGGLLNAPDVYMDKIAAGPGVPTDAIDLDNSAEDNIYNVAKAVGKNPPYVEDPVEDTVTYQKNVRNPIWKDPRHKTTTPYNPISTTYKNTAG